MRPLLFATKPATLALRAGMGLVLLGLAPAAGRADMIFGNLDAATGSDSSSQSLNVGNLYAVSFTMGSQDYSLSDVQIRLTFSPPANTTFQLRSDTSGHPTGGPLFTFTNPTFGSGQTTYTFTPGSPFTLAADTTYWLVGSTTSGLNANWAVTSPPTNPSGSGASFGSYSASTTGGGTWFNSAATTQFQLDGTTAIVPEPSSLVLTGTGVCVAAAVGLRRRRTRRP